jgi:hypothetical protein
MVIRRMLDDAGQGGAHPRCKAWCATLAYPVRTGARVVAPYCIDFGGLTTLASGLTADHFAKAFLMNASYLKQLVLLSAMLVVAAPAAATLTKLTVSGRILTGTDGGNDLIDVSNVGGVYVHTFAPGNFFGVSGSLVGKAIKFTMIYDPAALITPVGVGGVFDDTFGDWALSIKSRVSIDGVGRDLVTLPAGGLMLLGLGATLTLGNGATDSLAGDFSGFTAAGGNIWDYNSSNVHFAGRLPASFFSTDAVLPGALPGPGFGYGSGAAIGTGSFDFTRSTVFIDSSFKEAVGTFALTSARFGAVPEPASWAMLVGGFAIVGASARRRRTRAVAA